MSTLLHDLRFSLRLLAKTRGFTVAAIAVLALGIGVNTAIFSIARDLLFSARPFPNSREVVQLYTQDVREPKRFRLFSYPAYQELRAENTVFTDILAHSLTMVGIGEGELSRRTFAALVSSNYFSTLQVPLAQGRGFLPAEEQPGTAAPVVIASHLYWQKTGFDPALVGKTIRVNERVFTIIGITPEHFTGTMMLFGPELYFPLSDYDALINDFDSASRRSLERRDSYTLFLVGRLKPGTALETANAALKSLGGSFATAYPAEHREQTFLAAPLPRLSTSSNPADEGELAPLGGLLIGMAALVLLIACLNLANMLLARGAARKKEIAIRLALGGGRGRIVRQLMVEGFLLALAGGVLGLLLASWMSPLLNNSLAAHMPVALHYRGTADPVVLLVTLGFCAFATVGFALGPALKLARADMLAELKANAGEDAPRRGIPWLPRNPLVVVQVALSLGLLTAAGLFIRGAREAGSIETGFKAEDTVLIEVDASLGGYDQARSLQLYQAAGDRLAGTPGVQSASIGAIAPFGFITINRPVQRAGITAAPDAKPGSAAEGLAFTARWNAIGAGYFDAMGLPLLRGRGFTALEATTRDSPPVAIIDEVLARKLWPDGDALGQRVQWAPRDAPRASGGSSGNMGSSDTISARADDPKTIEIVGIVPATRWELFQEDPDGLIYVPFAQDFQSNAFFHVRLHPGATADPEALNATFAHLRSELRAAAPGVPVFMIKTFRQHLDASAQLWVVRIGAVLFSIFGGLALVLAVVGVYGVKAYSVARRTREIGIRMALGAEPGDVLRLIFREGFVMIATGAVIGLLLAVAIGRAATAMLYKVSPLDPWAFTIAPLTLIAAALFACWLPARRATRISPLTALRSE